MGSEISERCVLALCLMALKPDDYMFSREGDSKDWKTRNLKDDLDAAKIVARQILQVLNISEDDCRDRFEGTRWLDPATIVRDKMVKIETLRGIDYVQRYVNRGMK